MSASRLLTLFVLSTCLNSAHAQSNALLGIGTGSGAARPGFTVIPLGYNDRPQTVIPRYANGKTPPAGGLAGYGPGSVLRATEATERLPAATRAIVITQDYSQAIRQFQGRNPADAEKEAVLQPVIRDLTIAGRDMDGDDYRTHGQVNDSGNPGVDLYDGLRWRASGGLVENVNFFAIPGTAAIFQRGCCAKDKWGSLRPFDNEKLKLWNLNAARANRGFTIDVVDAVVGRISAHSCREFGVQFKAGATQIDGAIHVWGGEKAVWFTGDFNWGGPIYGEQGFVGIQIDSHGNDLGPLYSWGSTVACIVVTGNHNTLSQPRVNAMAGDQPIGVKVMGQYNTLSDGNIAVTKGRRGIVTDEIGGWGLRLRDVRVAGGDDKSKLIDLTGGKHGLYYSVIDVFLQGGGVGLDLTRDDGSSVLKVNNTIHVTTPINSGGLATIVDLPKGWQATTPRKTTNVITINGVRWYPPRDE